MSLLRDGTRTGQGVDESADPPGHRQQGGHLSYERETHTSPNHLFQPDKNTHSALNFGQRRRKIGDLPLDIDRRPVDVRRDFRKIPDDRREALIEDMQRLVHFLHRPPQLQQDGNAKSDEQQKGDTHDDQDDLRRRHGPSPSIAVFRRSSPVPPGTPPRLHLSPS